MLRNGFVFSIIFTAYRRPTNQALVLQMIDSFLKNFFSHKYKRKVKESLGVPSFHWSLQNLRRKGFNPGSVVDVGAYEGHWALDFLEVFPSSRILMVEAQRRKEVSLKKISSDFPSVAYAIDLLASTDGEQKYFFENETSSHILKPSEASADTVLLKTKTLDTLLKEKQFPLPDFLKLDVQGYEREILEGAETSLQHATVCLLELSLLNIGGDTPLLAEMIAYMDRKGFQAYDISQFIRRPYDKALYQIDMFFVKKNSRLVMEKEW